MFAKPLIKSFSQLSLKELYDILALRQEIFIVEQNCPYQDADGKDDPALHLMVYENDKLIAYTRLLERGISYPDYCSIGRVVCALDQRGKGLGKYLMLASINACKQYYPSQKIKISAQSHLKAFYESLDFKDTGDHYLEDDIPHMAMVYEPKVK